MPEHLAETYPRSLTHAESSLIARFAEVMAIEDVSALFVQIAKAKVAFEDNGHLTFWIDLPVPKIRSEAYDYELNGFFRDVDDGEATLTLHFVPNYISWIERLRFDGIPLVNCRPRADQLYFKEPPNLEPTG